MCSKMVLLVVLTTCEPRRNVSAGQPLLSLDTSPSISMMPPGEPWVCAPLALEGLVGDIDSESPLHATAETATTAVRNNPS